jgi:S-adenosylmethionine decarboxylase
LETAARHLLVEYWGCDASILDDAARLERVMRDAAVEAGARIVGSLFRPFDPQGVTGVVVLEESHLSIHTWPEQGYAAVDIYTCATCRPERAHALLMEALGAERGETLRVKRGLPSGMEPER